MKKEVIINKTPLTMTTGVPSVLANPSHLALPQASSVNLNYATVASPTSPDDFGG